MPIPSPAGPHPFTASVDMRPSYPPPTLTLIVAATGPHLGIGRAGTLPWPALKQEMAYFARVTKRAPAGHINAVVMGRKTWESVPARFRPLAGRANVVVSRNPTAVLASGEGFPHTLPRGTQGRSGQSGGPQSTEGRVEGPFAVASIAEGVELVQALYSAHPSGSVGSSASPTTPNSSSSNATASVTESPDPTRRPAATNPTPSDPALAAPTSAPASPPPPPPSLSRIFIIGGAEIYAAALTLPHATRILLTRVMTDFECDTFFPARLGGTATDHTTSTTADPKSHRGSRPAGPSAAGPEDGDRDLKQDGAREGESVEVEQAGEEAEKKKQKEKEKGTQGWVRKSKADLDAWAGEEVPAGRRREKGVEWEFEMWERTPEAEGRERGVEGEVTPGWG